MKLWVLLVPLFVLSFAGCEPYSPSAGAAPSSDEASPTPTNAAVASQETTEQPRLTGADSPHDASDGTRSAASNTTESQSTSATETPATAQPVRKGKPPPADRTPRRPGEAEKITFEDLNIGMQADVVFRPYMLMGQRVQELEGKRISIIGYMHAGQNSKRGIKEFILLKNTECKFGPGGQADHLANVLLKEGQTTGYTDGPIKVEGTLTITPFQGFDDNTWFIYTLESAQIR